MFSICNKCFVCVRITRQNTSSNHFMKLIISIKEIPVRKLFPSSSFRRHELTHRRAEGHQASGLNSFSQGMCGEAQVQAGSTPYCFGGALLQFTD